MIALSDLNDASVTDFTKALGEIFEHAAWVAGHAARARPFATVTGLHEGMCAAVAAAPPEQITTFLRGHPELSGAAALAGTMASHSAAEQAGLGLDRPADDIAGLNAAYSAKFELPFIICVRRHTRPSLLAEFRRRLQQDGALERAAALREVGFITRLRLAGLVSGPGIPIVNGCLAAHVTDTSTGRPAQGVGLALREAGRHTVLSSAVTDAQGRTGPLLQGAPLRIGQYELLLQGGDRADRGPVRFDISEPEAEYDIPLMI